MIIDLTSIGNLQSHSFLPERTLMYRYEKCYKGTRKQDMHITNWLKLAINDHEEWKKSGTIKKLLGNMWCGVSKQCFSGN